MAAAASSLLEGSPHLRRASSEMQNLGAAHPSPEPPPLRLPPLTVESGALPGCDGEREGGKKKEGGRDGFHPPPCKQASHTSGVCETERVLGGGQESLPEM